MVIYKEYKWRELPSWFIGSQAVAMVMMVIGFAAAFGYSWRSCSCRRRRPRCFLSMTDNKYVMLMLINVLLLLLGTFMDMAPMILICTPDHAAVVKAMGVDRCTSHDHAASTWASASLPAGRADAVRRCAIGKVTMEEVSRELWPFYGAMCAALLIVTYFPGSRFWLPRVLDIRS